MEARPVGSLAANAREQLAGFEPQPMALGDESRACSRAWSRRPRISSKEFPGIGHHRAPVEEAERDGLPATGACVRDAADDAGQLTAVDGVPASQIGGAISFSQSG